jgi:hypothetical protein
MKNVYLSILHLTVKAFKFHCKKNFLPASPSPTLPFARFIGFAGITTVSQFASAFVHLVFSKNKRVFFQVSFFF